LLAIYGIDPHTHANGHVVIPINEFTVNEKHITQHDDDDEHALLPSTTARSYDASNGYIITITIL